MMQWNRAWLFFVIVAVGLVLSWGQVGRKASRTLAEDRSPLLATERPCAPRESPCAAYGEAMGLVLGPDGPGLLRLKAVGDARPQLREALLVQHGHGKAQAQPLGTEPLGPGHWRLRLPDAVPQGGPLELQLRLEAPPASAVFPLR